MVSYHQRLIEQKPRSLLGFFPERGRPGHVFKSPPHATRQCDFITGGEKQAGVSHNFSQCSNIRCDYESAAEHIFYGN
jgi:hypothetical protein